ncbi:synaptotagmin-2 [Pelobates cultripes]|uniref:Synaptotagmin-2 n=1 Tax=Pelobates cultripes TaxID=61616 RepID=A0AAD1VJL2_PELCU|nr:synaptotagmin-2 [Pelobates cultripes]
MLPVLSKIVEKCVHTQLCEYYQQSNYLTTDQSGFRPNHRITTALLKVCNDIQTGMEQGDLTEAIFLDFAKADTVDHDIVLQKLKNSVTMVWPFGKHESAAAVRNTTQPPIVSHDNSTEVAGSGDKAADAFRKIQQELMNQISKIPLPPWALIAIAVVGGLLIITCCFCICKKCCCKKKKGKKEKGKGKGMKNVLNMKDLKGGGGQVTI